MAININHKTDTITATTGTLNLPNFAGGGLTHFVESEGTASPNNTRPVDALTATDASYSNLDVALAAKGTGATLAQVPDGTATGGNKRGEYATDFQKSRWLGTEAATGDYASILGGRYNSASGFASSIIGGQYNISSGMVSLSYGDGCTASNFASVAIGYGNYVSGLYSTCVGGSSSQITADKAVVIGGEAHLANSEASAVVGGVYGTTRGIVGYCVNPASANPLGSYNYGTSQTATLVLGGQTTDSTPMLLKSNTSSPSSSNQLTVPLNSLYSVRGDVIAGVTDGGDAARWSFEVVVKCGSTLGSITIMSPAQVNKTHGDTNTVNWYVGLGLNSTLNCLEVYAYGAAATPIRWVCRLDTVEMTF